MEGQGDLNRPRRAHVRHQQGDRRGRMGAKDRRSRKRRGSHCAAGHPRHGKSAPPVANSASAASSRRPTSLPGAGEPVRSAAIWRLRLLRASRYFAAMAARIRTDGFVDPCVPTLSAKPPFGPDWVHETDRAPGRQGRAVIHAPRPRLDGSLSLDRRRRRHTAGAVMAPMASPCSTPSTGAACHQRHPTGLRPTGA